MNWWPIRNIQLCSITAVSESLVTFGIHFLSTQLLHPLTVEGYSGIHFDIVCLWERFMEPMLCSTSTAQSYIVQLRPALYSQKRPQFIIAIFKFAFWAWFIWPVLIVTFQCQTFFDWVCSLRTLIPKRKLPKDPHIQTKVFFWVWGSLESIPSPKTFDLESSSYVGQINKGQIANLKRTG